MTKMARTSASRVRSMASREIQWEFTVDRFGVRSETGSSESLKVEFARKAVHSLSYWLQTVEFLYGNADVINLATDAGVLPQYPYWQSVAQTIELLQNWLTPQRPRGAGDDFSTVGLPDSYAVTRSIDEKIVDPRTQDLVEQLRLYLEGMQTSAPVFRAATWVASLAGTGSAMPTPQERLLQGLKSVIAVYELDATLDPVAVLKRFAEVQSGSSGISSFLPQFKSILKQGENLLQYSGSVPDFSPEPILFHQWLQEFREAAQDYPHQTSIVPATSWDSVEDAYWRQWRWPSIGAVFRVSIDGTGTDSAGVTSAGGVSMLDLIYTTRYGSVPLLHWRGGNLSICQWSRILTIASLRRTKALQAPSVAGVGNLGFSASSMPPDGLSGTIAGGPIVMISPFSEHTAVWTWRPEPGIRAVALVPRKLAGDDEEVSAGLNTATPTQPVNDGWAEIAARVVQVEQHSTALIHLVEMVGGQRPEESPISEWLPWAPWKQIGFGSGQGRPPQRFISEPPRSLGELVDLTRRHYPEVFPTLVDEEDTALVRFFYRLGRLIRSIQYDMLWGFAVIARRLGLSRRRRRLASFVRQVRDSYLRR